MSSDELASKLSQSGIPESSRNKIINCIIKHLMDSDESEGKASTNRLVTGDTANTADANKDVQRALSNIEQLNPNHPLIQRVQRDTGIQDPQLATQYTEQTLRAMKEHANENPERMRSIFMSSRSKKERDLDGSFLHDGYDSF
ncbi:MAG: hypothetical protein WBZ36_31120 [Candidatus Nitrosopolaris sp.]